MVGRTDGVFRPLVYRPLALLAPAPAQPPAPVQAHDAQPRLPAFAQRERQAAKRRRVEDAQPAVVGKVRRRGRGAHPPLPGGKDYAQRKAIWDESERKRQLPVPAPTAPPKKQRAPVPQQVVGDVAPYPGHIMVQGGFGGFQEQFPPVAAGFQEQVQAPMPAAPLPPQRLGDVLGYFGGYQDPLPNQMQAPELAFPDQQDMARPVEGFQDPAWEWDFGAVPYKHLPVAPAMGPLNMALTGAYLVALQEQVNFAALTPGIDPGFNVAEAILTLQMAGYFPDPALQFNQAAFAPEIPPIDPAQGLFDIPEVVGDLQPAPVEPTRPEVTQAESLPNPPGALNDGTRASSSSSQRSLGEVVTPPEDEDLQAARAAIAAFADQFE
ncbi:hypothetical protein EKO04_010631 [Ascochyta lentis]|uniref:Uncharacterized protein n=1 Tax=Ascochyta lentis TaxID=205686 RepID=A0A8H7IWL3_9PLEO|nr:hypothetical protein EKO04_010631 [Ascochyta lentis]